MAFKWIHATPSKFLNGYNKILKSAACLILHAVGKKFCVRIERLSYYTVQKIDWLDSILCQIGNISAM